MSRFLNLRVTAQRFYRSDRGRPYGALNLNISSDQPTAGVCAPVANSMGVIVHGANANMARPTGHSQIIWIGAAEPVNKETNDIWFQNNN